MKRILIFSRLGISTLSALLAIIIVAKVAVLSVDYAMAQPLTGAVDSIRNEMMKMDTDKDGMISKAEYLAAKSKSFADLDRDGDGILNADEQKEMLSEATKQRKEPSITEPPALSENSGPEHKTNL